MYACYSHQTESHASAYLTAIASTLAPSRGSNLCLASCVSILSHLRVDSPCREIGPAPPAPAPSHTPLHTGQPESMCRDVQPPWSPVQEVLLRPCRHPGLVWLQFNISLYTHRKCPRRVGPAWTYHNTPTAYTRSATFLPLVLQLDSSRLGYIYAINQVYPPPFILHPLARAMPVPVDNVEADHRVQQYRQRKIEDKGHPQSDPQLCTVMQVKVRLLGRTFRRVSAMAHVCARLFSQNPSSRTSYYDTIRWAHRVYPMGDCVQRQQPGEEQLLRPNPHQATHVQRAAHVPCVCLDQQPA